MAQRLPNYLTTATGIEHTVEIFTADGDGNCLFRALSLGLTGSQDHHQRFRELVVDHMINNQDSLQQLYTATPEQEQAVAVQIQQMRELGCWGTEREILTAANLFNVTIFCYSGYGYKGLRLQQFVPHFMFYPNCDETCHHSSVFVVNSSGNHYNVATVSSRNGSDVEE